MTKVQVALDIGSVFRSAGEVEQIGYGFEWIVDLVRDRSGQSAHGRQLFGLQQRGGLLFPCGHVLRESNDAFPSRLDSQVYCDVERIRIRRLKVGGTPSFIALS
jgi:hypothetical protein